MKKIVTCLIGILFFVFPVVARDALTADLRLSLIGGGTWVNGTTELNKKSVDYKTNWQPFGVQESCDFFIHVFFVGIHEEIGLAAANLNTKDFKTVGNYTYDGTPAKHSTNNCYTSYILGRFLRCVPQRLYRLILRRSLDLNKCCMQVPMSKAI